MKNYIFYTTDGLTEDNRNQDVENCQILGWQKGNNAKKAFENLKKENLNLNFENISCQELASEQVFYF